METVHLTAHADADGHLALELPATMRGRDVEVTVTAKAPSPWNGVPRDELGYPFGFKERFFGAYPDEPDKLP